MTLPQQRITFAAIIAIAIVGTFFICTAEWSPLYRLFLDHPALGNFLGFLCLPAAIVAAMLSGNVHGGSEVVFAIAAAAQWFAIGYGLASLIFRER